MRLVVFVICFSLFLFAHECEDRLFSLQAYTHQGKGIRLIDVLRDISVRCGVSVDFEDKEAKRIAYSRPLDFVNIKDYTFEEFLDFLAKKQNLFLSFDREHAVVTISYVKTKSFPIDYVNVSSIESKNSKTISTGAATGIGSTTGTTYGGSVATGTVGGVGTRTGSSSSADTTTIDTTLTFTFWDTLEENIRRLVKNTDFFNLVVDKDASLVIVSATRKDMERVAHYIDSLMERMHQQVMIEAKFIELTYSDSQQIGVDWSRFSIDFNATIQGQKERNDAPVIGRLTLPNYTLAYNFSAAALFDFLKSYGKIKILSSPKVMTLNNQPAIINVGQQLSYRYQSGTINTTQNAAPVGTTTYTIGSTFVGITLFVIPEISKNGQIIMRINPVISDTTSTQENTTIRELPPDIFIKQLTSIVKVKDGQKVLIGGLVSFQKNRNDTKVPILGDIPIVGRAFHSTKHQLQRKELFILLTPKIVNKSYIPTIDEAKIFGTMR